VTVEGITTPVILSHHWKAFSAIEVILLWNVIIHGLDLHNVQQPVLDLQTTVPIIVGDIVGADVGIGVGLPSKYVGDIVGGIVGVHAAVVGNALVNIVREIVGSQSLIQVNGHSQKALSPIYMTLVGMLTTLSDMHR